MDQASTPEQLRLDDARGVPDAQQVGFSGRKTADIVGISYRQLDYWARTGLVRPSLAEARGSGSRRLYSYRDLVELKVIKTLLDAGLKLESVREVFSYMREQLGEDISSANLVISSKSSVLVRSGEELVDVLQKGQGVFNVLALAGVKDEIDTRILELRPAGSAGGDDAVPAEGERAVANGSTSDGSARSTAL